MKTCKLIPLIAVTLSTVTWSWSASTINSVNHHAYAANLGWLDWRGDTNNGAVIGEYVCSGYIYSANVGWINLGSSTPTNGIYYQNLSANDFGVNQDGFGNLRGYAWGANIGWINFANTGAPKLDLLTGNLSGSVWSANCGWISLSNAVAHVQTDTIQAAPLAPNGLPIPWLLQEFGTTNVDANADPDHDGASNLQEYLAGTHPNDPGDALRITGFQRGLFGNPDYNGLQWTSQFTRFYAVQQCSVLGGTNVWADMFVSPWAGVAGISFTDTNINRFYRVRAYRPLTP